MLSAESIEPTKPAESALDISNILDKPVPKAINNYLQAAAGQHSDISRKPGLFLVQEDLQKIKRFCRHVNQLPTHPLEVVTYLGYSESVVAGLGPSRIAILHKNLQQLADLWASVEKSMITVSTTLMAFSDELKSFGGAIIGLIKKMEGYTSHAGMVEDVAEEELASLPPIPLQGPDSRVIPSLLSLVQELVNIIDGYKADANKVKMHIAYFRDELRTARDDISRKLTLFVKTNGNEQAAELNEEISRYNTRIAELEKSYSVYTDYKWVGAWWGPVGIGITWSIFGPKASAIKESYEKEIQNKKKLESRIEKLNKAMPALIRLEADLQNMLLLTEEALSGAGNLENIWTIIGAYITASAKNIRNTKNATTLFIFETRLSHMIAQWGNVDQEARLLMQALNQDYETKLT